MAELRNFKRLMRSLEKYERESQRKNTGDVLVGFQTNYALYVHETPPPGMAAAGTTGHTARHKPGKQWKYLEQPARELSNNGVLAKIVVDTAAKGKGLIKALLVAGMRLQREAQRIVPVALGNLKGSAFTAKE